MTIKMLIVDDDAALASILALHFEDRGFTVTEMSSCRAARALLGTRKFKIALLDYQLHDGCGLDLAQALRQAEPSVRIIVMSGSDDPTLRERLFAEGLEHFLSKPLRAQELDSVVRQALDR